MADNWMVYWEFDESSEEVRISLWPQGRDDLDNSLDQLFSSIQSVKILTLGEMSIEYLFEDFIPPPLHNVWCLHINILSCIHDKLVPAMVSLFKGLPILNTLDITMSSMSCFQQWHGPLNPLGFAPFCCSRRGAQASKFDKAYWELQNLGFISQLRKATIEVTSGSNGFGFAKYVLEHAQNLREMVVIYLPEQSNFVRELCSSRYTSNASVVFLERS